MPEEKVREYFSPIDEESFRVFLDIVLLDRPRMGEVKNPFLVFGALNDAALSPALIEATARSCGTKAVFIPDMAHDMMLEAGWKAVADRILVWLGEQGLQPLRSRRGRSLPLLGAPPRTPDTSDAARR